MPSLKSKNKDRLHWGDPDPRNTDVPAQVFEELEYSDPLVHIYRYLVAVGRYQHYRDIAESDYVDRSYSNVSNHLNDDRLAQMLETDEIDNKKHVRITDDWLPDNVDNEPPQPTSFQEAIEDEPTNLLIAFCGLSIFGLLLILVELSSIPTTLALRPLYLLVGVPIGGLVGVSIRAYTRVQ